LVLALFEVGQLQRDRPSITPAWRWTSAPRGILSRIKYQTNNSIAFQSAIMKSVGPDISRDQGFFGLFSTSAFSGPGTKLALFLTPYEDHLS
jgi:hypothetical protein